LFVGDAAGFMVVREGVGEAVVGEAVVGEAVVGEWVVGDAVVGDEVVGEAVVGGELVVGEAVVGVAVGDTVMVVGDCVVPINQIGTPSYPMPLPHAVPASTTVIGRRQSLATSV
jgi:hypothetical protein